AASCGSKLDIERRDPLVEVMPLRTHVFNQHADTRAQLRAFGVIGVQPLGKIACETAPALCDGDAALEKHRPKLVHKSRALAPEPRAGAAQGLHVELVLALQIDKPHRWPGRRF